MKALMGNSRKEAVAIVTCGELKSNLFKALVLPTFTYGIETWGGNLKNSLECFREGNEDTQMSHVKVCSSTTYYICWPNSKNILWNYMLSSLLWAFNNGLPTYPPLGQLVKHPHYPNTQPNKDLTLGSNRQPYGKPHGVYLIGKPMTTQPHQK